MRGTPMIVHIPGACHDVQNLILVSLHLAAKGYASRVKVKLVSAVISINPFRHLSYGQLNQFTPKS